jgi:hypothetical protein
MSWLARLDARAAVAPTPIHWAYLGLRWGLLLMGVWLVLAMAWVELVHESRVGLGLGMTIVLAVTGITWLRSPDGRRLLDRLGIWPYRP